MRVIYYKCGIIDESKNNSISENENENENCNTNESVGKIIGKIIGKSENNSIGGIIDKSERLSSSTPGAISLRSIAPVQVSLRENSHVQHKSFWIVRNVAEGLCDAQPDNLHAGSATSIVKRLNLNENERRKENYCYP